MLALTKAFGALYLASVLMQLGSTLLMTYLALRLSADGVAEFWGGALMAANSLGLVLGSKVGHWLIERVGHIRTYVACAGVISAAVLGHEFSAALPLWLLLRFVVGLAMMCQLMVLESWLNDRAQSDERGKVLGLYMVAIYVGMVLGQLALSLNGDLGIHALLGVAMAFALCLVPVALTRSSHPAALPSASTDVRLFLRRVPQSLATILMSGMINGAFYGLAAIYASRQGLDTVQVGQFMAVVIGAGLLAQLPLGWLSDRLPRAALIRAVALLLILAFLPLGLFHSPSFAVVLLVGAVIGLLQFCLYPLGVALANDNVEAELRVSLAGVLLVAYGIGACIGPLLAGVLMEHFGVWSLYYFFAACAALLALAVSQKRVTGVYLQADAPLQHQATPIGLASATLPAAVQPLEDAPGAASPESSGPIESATT
ncbi:MFS transporter [Pseudomonas benzenivorans]|uniref:MFS transporter n=1 Tax=Pseudomonas benzenivorans TaxID=556533 RepID=A0ABZ0PZK6_9PSED|nr:MFS transporter [Pseudomonas benzenivorans]WPC06310.1 MFS transporter [Pseudomonas benzenivorans]